MAVLLLKGKGSKTDSRFRKKNDFEAYYIGDVIHSSSDGQKFETLLQTIDARYSPKYFGLMKEVVAYTLVSNHIPVSPRVIGAMSIRAIMCLTCSTITEPISS